MERVFCIHKSVNMLLLDVWGKQQQQYLHTESFVKTRNNMTVLRD